MEKQQPKQTEPPWKPYVGKNVRASYSEGLVNGRMQEPDLETANVDFLPHIVYNPDGSCYLEQNIPRRIGLNRLFGNGNNDIFHYKNEKHLEWLVEETNKAIKKNKSSIRGFSG